MIWEVLRRRSLIRFIASTSPQFDHPTAIRSATKKDRECRPRSKSLAQPFATKKRNHTSAVSVSVSLNLKIEGLQAL
jgi:hypothetical protein